MAQTPKLENFTLKKVKLIHGSEPGLNVTYSIADNQDNCTFIDSDDKKSTKVPSPELIKSIINLRSCLARVMNYTVLRAIVSNNEFKATSFQSNAIEKYLIEIINKFNVSGITITGTGSKQGISISGTFYTDSNQKIAINTGTILVSGTKYGFEDELPDFIISLKEQVFDYLFNYKNSQPSLFDNIEEDSNEQEPVKIDTKVAKEPQKPKSKKSANDEIVFKPLSNNDDEFVDDLPFSDEFVDDLPFSDEL